MKQIATNGKRCNNLLTASSIKQQAVIKNYICHRRVILTSQMPNTKALSGHGVKDIDWLIRLNQ
jgi:hypothetical protein